MKIEANAVRYLKINEHYGGRFPRRMFFIQLTKECNDLEQLLGHRQIYLAPNLGVHNVSYYASFGTWSIQLGAHERGGVL